MGKPLTERRLQTIKPPATGRLEIADGGCPGLQIRVTPNDVRSWYYVYRLHGHKAKVLLGHYPALTLAHARKTAKQRAADVARGVDPAHEKRRAAEQGRAARANSVEALAALFIDTKKSLRTWRKIETDLRFHVLPKWGKLPIQSINKADANRLIDGIASKSGKHMARLVRSHLFTMFKWAENRNYTSDNVFRNVENPLGSDARARERKLTPVEIRKVWKAAERLGWPYGPLVRVLLYTGQRKGEVANMRWSNLDLKNGVWELSAEQTKAERAHTVPLAPQVVALLKTLPRFAESDWVFSFDGRKPVNSFGAAKAELDKLSGVSDWRLHDIRRTCGNTLRARLRVSIDIVGQCLNHAAIGVTAKHYAQDHDETAKRRALKLWADYLDSVIRGDADTGKIVAFAGAGR